MFLTGYIAGVHFVQTVAKLLADDVAPAIVSVGRTAEGDVEVLSHDNLEDAFDQVVIALYSYAVVATIEGDLHRWFVCRPDVPDDMVARVELRASLGPANARRVTTSTPTVEGEDFDAEGYFDGFAAGLDAEEHAFEISFGTLDVMAAMLCTEDPQLTPETLQG